VGDLVYLKPGRRRGFLRATGAVAHYELGLALEAVDIARAEVAYRRAIGRSAGFGDAHNNLGRLLHDRGQLDEAEACYRAAIRADDRVALYWFNLGVVVEDRGHADEAIAAYEQALSLDPYLADAHYNLARHLEQRGRRGDDLALRRAVRHLHRYRDLQRAHS
jgi:tetratricopeptide (TPR) repeat protein